MIFLNVVIHFALQLSGATLENLDGDWTPVRVQQ